MKISSSPNHSFPYLHPPSSSSPLFSPKSTPSIYLLPEKNRPPRDNNQTRQKKYTVRQGKVFTSRLDKATQHDEKIPKSRQKSQEQSCSHCQEFHETASRTATHICSGPCRPLQASVFAASVSVSPQEPCLVDSVDHICPVSSKPSDSYNLSFLFSLRFPGL